MLLTITTTHAPLRLILDICSTRILRIHDFNLTFGRAHVFYLEVSEERCTAALLVEVDPIWAQRRKQRELTLDPVWAKVV